MDIITRITRHICIKGLIAASTLMTCSVGSALDLSFTEGFENQPVYYGIGLSQHTIDTDSQFSVGGLSIQSGFDEKQTGINAFFGLPYDNNLGIEFNISYIGQFEFNGNVEGSNVGTLVGEQTLFGLGTSIYAQKHFDLFTGKTFAGAMLMHSQTEGEIDLVGSDPQSLDYSESRASLLLGLEAQREVKEDWLLAGGISFINSGDPIQSFGLKLIRIVRE